MLDSTTKQKIDSLRNLLVGKVPDPKSQVEQITIALFYKFMWDRDKEIKDLGGNATFFIDEFEKYSWENLFAQDLGGAECIKLYGEAIEEMENNPNIPSIFREIFKRAFLPYNDPHTLRLFLEEINDFHYSDSEKLGDGFEYLISILGTQGDAGQFRTPRHIIDFIVEIVNPQKRDRICDPACGTAGFVISAYKHILKNNTKETEGDLLTPEDRKRLGNNLLGLDIDPMMVKLALANMYLHGLNEPHIYEYDSLTSEKRWSDPYDVMLANPPFMTPTGGIRPHKKFAVNATKAEVLFTSYINTHLSNNGRAGIIVPEGIIFQSQNAYKDLRKQLIESSLIGVISLPSGVFNPYSGVKTSVLILDKELNKKTDKIFFAKVENDGFDLGSQRREIDKNDLPGISKAINEYSSNLKKGLIDEHESLIYVTKDEILSSSDLGLSFERYQKIEINSNIGTIHLKDCIELTRGITYKKNQEVEFSNTGVLRANNIDVETSKLVIEDLKYVDDIVRTKESQKIKVDDIIICLASGSKTHIGKVAYVYKNYGFYVGGFMGIIRTNENILSKYLYFNLSSSKFNEYLRRVLTTTSINNLNNKLLDGFNIPLPPLEIQKEIVKELEQYQKVIDGAKQIVDNYKPYFEIDESWDTINLGELTSLMTGGTPSTKEKKNYENGSIKWLVSGDIHKGIINDCKGRITEQGLNSSNTRYLPQGSVLIALNGQGKTRGTVAVLDTKAVCNQSLVSINPNDTTKLNNFYLYYVLKSKYNEIRRITGDKDRRGLNMTLIREITIPLPGIDIQKQIVEKLEAERKIVEGNKKLIEIYSKKIEDRINKIWGD